MVDNVSKSMTLLPEYQEKFLKDLLANVYQVDEESGTITGIAAQSPLEGQQYYQTADGGSTLDPTLAAMDEAGNPIKLYQSTSGGFTSDSTMASQDQYGQPIFAMEGGVGAPDVIGFTDAQVDALDRLMGATDEDGNVIYEGMMDVYKPYIDESLLTFQKGTDLAGSAGTARYDPQGQIVYERVPVSDTSTAMSMDQTGVGRVVTPPDLRDGNQQGMMQQTLDDGVEYSYQPKIDPDTGEIEREGGYKDFYDPFVEDVIDVTQADIQRAGDINKIGERARAVGSGAFGGSRQAVAEQELQRGIEDQKARTGAQLRSAAYTGAQQQAQSAFENQQNRGLTASNLFQGLGTGIGALGETAQSQGFQDFNTLFNAGQLEQQQLQRQYDVQRAADLEQAYEPFSRFSYMRDILQGVPSSGTSLAAAATPQASPLGAALNYAGQLGGATGGISTLGSIINRGT